MVKFRIKIQNSTVVEKMMRIGPLYERYHVPRSNGIT